MTPVSSTPTLATVISATLAAAMPSAGAAASAADGLRRAAGRQQRDQRETGREHQRRHGQRAPRRPAARAAPRPTTSAAAARPSGRVRRRSPTAGRVYRPRGHEALGGTCERRGRVPGSAADRPPPRVAPDYTSRFPSRPAPRCRGPSSRSCSAPGPRLAQRSTAASSSAACACPLRTFRRAVRAARSDGIRPGRPGRARQLCSAAAAGWLGVAALLVAAGVVVARRLAPA